MAALPKPRTPDPRLAPPLRWGILGPGWIAERFAAALGRHTAQRVHAVGSRDAARAEAFARAVGAPAAYGSYAALVADPDVDVIYVATPHNLHHEHALQAIAAGKHVLIEKPVAVTAAQGREVAAAAAAAGVFCMEALWTLFLPKYDVIRQLLVDTRVETVLADMGEYFPPEHRIQRADLAGGPIFDLGTYPIGVALWALGAGGRPVDGLTVTAAGTPAPSGINGQLAITLSDADRVATLHCSILGESPTMASIIGADQTISLDGPFYQPGGFTVRTRDGRTLRYAEPATAHEGGLHFQAAEVARRIAAGELASPLRPMTDSIAMLTVMDVVRAQVGIPIP